MKYVTRTRSGIAFLATAGIVVAGAGVAYAYWTTTGTGSGTAAVGSPITMTVTSAGVSGLYPKEKTTIPVTVTNTNPYPVTIQNVTLDSVAATSSDCNNTDITLNSAATGVSGTTYTVAGSLTPSGTGVSASTTLNLPIAVADLAQLCQGANHSFTLNFTVHGVSS